MAAESAWERLQREKAEGKLPGQMDRDPESPRQDTRRDKRETREEQGIPEPTRRELNDLAREVRKDEARAKQQALVDARDRGLERRLPDVPRPDDGFDEAFRNARPNLKEGPVLAPSPVFDSNDKHKGHYQPTPVPQPEQQPFKPRVTAGGSGAARPARWSVYGNETGVYFCRVGKVWLGSEGTEEAIVDGNASISISIPGAVWLEVADANVTSITLDSGTPPADLYASSAGNMTYYRKIIGDFSTSDPGTAGYSLGNISGNDTWYRPRVGDYDLTAVSTVVAIDGNATLAVELQPY